MQKLTSTKSREGIQKLNSKLVLLTEGSRGSAKVKHLIFYNSLTCTWIQARNTQIYMYTNIFWIGV